MTNLLSIFSDSLMASFLTSLSMSFFMASTSTLPSSGETLP